MDNPLLREPLRREHVKPRLLGHWGTTPGLNFVYAHLNRVIRARDLDMIFVCGPGHGGPGMVANTYLEGTYSEIYPDIALDAAGMTEAVPAVLLPRRHPQPCRTGDARVDPRGRGTGLLPCPRLRRRLRQPRPRRRLRDRRRRGRDRPARSVLALQQVPPSRARRRGPADPPPQRLQDRQPDRARPHRAGRTSQPSLRLRLRALLRRGRRARGDAPVDGADAGRVLERSPPSRTRPARASSRRRRAGR